MFNNMKFMNVNYRVCILLLFAVVFINLFTNCFSPFYRFEYNLDPAAFYTEGRAWANGYLPYRDFIDVKGIFLFFIYSVGYIISPNEVWGMFFIYTLFSFFFAMYLYKICQIFKLSSFLSLTITLTCLILQYNFRTAYWGAQPELLINTFLAWGLYYCVSHIEGSLKNKDIILSGVSLGIGCAASFLIKYNVCLAYVAYFVIQVTLFVRNKIPCRFIILYTSTCILTFFAFCAPFIFYMWQKDIFHEFIYCYFKLNVSAYSSIYAESVPDNIHFRLMNIIRGAGLLPTLITLSVLGEFLCRFISIKKISLTNCCYTTLVVCFYFLCFVGRWGYYYIMFSPVAIIFIIRLALHYQSQLADKFKPYINSCYAKKCVIIGLIILCVLSNGHVFTDRGFNRNNTKQMKVIEKEMSKISNPTILYYRIVDCGLAMNAGPLPAIPAWSLFLPLHEQSQKQAIENKIPDFVYTREENGSFLKQSGYELINGSQFNGCMLFRINSQR